MGDVGSQCGSPHACGVFAAVAPGWYRPLGRGCCYPVAPVPSVFTTELSLGIGGSPGYTGDAGSVPRHGVTRRKRKSVPLVLRLAGPLIVMATPRGSICPQ